MYSLHESPDTQVLAKRAVNISTGNIVLLYCSPAMLERFQMPISLSGQWLLRLCLAF